VTAIDELRASLEAAMTEERLAKLDVAATVAAQHEAAAVLHQARANDIRADIDHDVARHTLELATSEVRRLANELAKVTESTAKTVN
jgi:hypothetical protein